VDSIVKPEEATKGFARLAQGPMGKVVVRVQDKMSLDLLAMDIQENLEPFALQSSPERF
jgi:hypothetical protein